MHESPLFATMTGDHRFDDRLPSMTMADLERRTAASRAQLDPSPGDRQRLSRARRPGQLRHVRARVAGRPHARRVPFLARPDHERQRLPHRDLPPRAGGPARDREGLRELRRPPARGAGLLRPARGVHARGPANRVHEPARHARGLRRHHAHARRRLSGKERPLEAVRGIPRGRPRPRTRAASRRGPGRHRHGRGARLPFPARFLHPGVRARRPNDDRGLGASRREGVLRVAREALHDPRHDPGGGAPDRRRRDRADSARDGRARAQVRIPGLVPGVPRASCARTRASTRRPPTTC